MMEKVTLTREQATKLVSYFIDDLKRIIREDLQTQKEKKGDGK